MFSVSRRSRVFAAVLLFGCAALLLIGGSVRKFLPVARSSQAIPPRVTNKTSSVRISNVRRSGNGDVEVSLFNQSTKTIYAYTIVTGNEGVRKGFTTFATAAPLPPGETKVEIIPARNLDSVAARNPDGAGEILFSAVYLEGGTAEGDPTDSGSLTRTMGGMKEQAKLAVQVLRDAGASHEQDSKRLLETVESQIASIAVKDESATSSQERERGKTMVNERLLRAIKKLRMRNATPGSDMKVQLAELISYYEQLAEKL
jgi:hypothetical protein